MLNQKILSNLNYSFNYYLQ